MPSSKYPRLGLKPDNPEVLWMDMGDPVLYRLIEVR
jgi:hypothetical protein